MVSLDFRFYDYNPDSDGELIVTTFFQLGKFKCNTEGFTNKGGEYPYCNKRYICHYTRDNRRYKNICYDTYSGYDEEEIKKSIINHIEFCYNKNKKGRKIKLQSK